MDGNSSRDDSVGSNNTTTTTPVVPTPAQRIPCNYCKQQRLTVNTFPCKTEGCTSRMCSACYAGLMKKGGEQAILCGKCKLQAHLK
jgi:hypothetical protein